MEEIGVSVLCATYNQEKYIRQALESFVMQKTNFPFEVIVNDDASTDKTPEIIKEYAEKYPNIIKPIYQKENQYSKGISIIMECCYPKAKGKYLAWCEGDDFLIDENKLQMQYDIMEKNPNCHLCLHKVGLISKDGKSLNRTLPNFNLQEKIISTKEFFKLTIPNHNFHTSSYFLRREEYKNYIVDFMNIRKMFRNCGIGDIPILLYFGQLNEIYYINKIMSNYRMFSLNSWSSRVKLKSANYLIQKHNDFIKAIEEFDKYSLYKYHNLCIKKIFFDSVQIAKLTTPRKDLLFKKRKEFFGRFNLFQKLVLFICVLFPNSAIMFFKICAKIYKVFKY